jgi:hypothetical protein
VAHPPHIDRKELREPDAVIERLGLATSYFREHRNRVLAIGGALAAVFIGVVFWRGQVERSADRAAAGFLRATDALDLDSRETAATALSGLEKTAGGIYRDLATLYRANLETEAGKCSEAVALYEQAAVEASAPYVRQIALVGKAFCQETLNQPAEAAASYAAAGKLDGPYREPALRGQLRNATSAQDKALAASAVEALLEAFPEAEDADELSKTLEALKG